MLSGGLSPRDRKCLCSWPSPLFPNGTVHADENFGGERKEYKQKPLKKGTAIPGSRKLLLGQGPRVDFLHQGF